MELIVDYYQSILKLKKKFAKQLEVYCQKKHEIYKIWAHWLIRTLSKKKVNYHLLSKIESESDPDIVKHMLQNQIPLQTAITINQQLVKEYNYLNDLYGEQHIDFLLDYQKIVEFLQCIEVYQSGDQCILSIIDYPVYVKINYLKYTQLVKLYQGHRELINFYIFEYGFNYYLLDGKSLQWSIPPKAFDYLKNLGLNGELFASPLNHQYPNYYSLFYIDTLFGSKGNFFSITPNQIDGGLYEVNPPFIEEIFTNSSYLILDLLKHAKKPLGFIYIMPKWEDLFGYDFLTDSEYFLGKIVMSKYQHTYYQTSNNKLILASFDTVVLFLGNYNKIKDYSVDTSQVLKALSSKFISI